MKIFHWCHSIWLSAIVLSADTLPRSVSTFIGQHCFECHEGSNDSLKGDVDLGQASFDWSSPEIVDLWTTIHDVVGSNDMPPNDAGSFPGTQERDEFLGWLKEKLTRHAPVGGTLPRRLNRVEYENTVRDLFGYPEFEVPPSFPSDTSRHGFDNVASGMVLSPPLLAQYLEIATAIADEFLPQPISLPKAEPLDYSIPMSELSTDAGGGGRQMGSVFRLVSSRNMASGAGWTSSFEAPVSGIYRVQIEANTFQSDRMFYDQRKVPFKLAVYARQNGEQKYARFSDLRKIGEFKVSTEPSEGGFGTLEAELFQGEVLGFRWADGPVFSDPGRIDLSHDFIDDRLLNDRPFYAAAIELNGGKRGSTQTEFYEAIRTLIESGQLDLSNPDLDKPPAVYGGGLFNGPHNWCQSYAHEQMYRFGPALDIVRVSVSGPSRTVSSQKERARMVRSKAFLNRRSDEVSDLVFTERFLRGFLSKAFRRPVSSLQLDKYLDLVRAHRESFPDKRIEDALHLVIRKALLSSRFLFRELGSGSLDGFELASRLSYFLTSAPPDDRLISLAVKGKLSDPMTLKNEAYRLLRLPQRRAFVRHFTGQWLGTRKLTDIMPDPRLLKFYGPDRQAMINETELFFEEMLVENHSLEYFIDPGFSFRNQNLNKIYGGEITGNKMQRVTFPKGGKQGGLLGLASIMMATANGVDTHPVHRGVWLLENVLGQPTPPPPADVPSVAPDTSGTITMREKMLAHQADASCARCHTKIDPLGFVMEHYDPVGRWREYYPVYTELASAPLKEEFYASQGEGTQKGRHIDTRAVMPDGTVLKDVTDLKAYLVTHIDLFVECLAEKLLIYGTGRPLSFGDQRIARALSQQITGNKRGFQDMIVSVILSDSFLSR